MLEEKLRHASETTARHRKRTVLFLGAGLLFCVIFIVVVSFLPVKTPRTTSGETVSVDHTPAVDSPGLRQQFMQQLQAYEGTLEPEISGANLKNWNLEKEAEIHALKEHAITSFGLNDYASALTKLSHLNTVAKQTLVTRNAMFSAEISMVRHALNEKSYTEGKLHITKALLLKQSDQEARSLNTRVKALPILLELLKKADVARAENKPEKEYAALLKAVNIAPHREALKQRRDALASSIRENQFTIQISRGLSNVEKEDIRAARRNYKKAESLYSGRSELRALNAAIVKASAALDFKHAVANAGKAIAGDDWVRAQSIYADALKRHPDDTTILDGLQLASKLVSLQHAMADYIHRPERLSSPNISAGARDTLIQARVFAHNSQSLSRQIARLQNLLAGMNVKIPVFVKSDNQTYILVRGVGKVGTTLGRTIQLTPGEYTFEGIRSGYKSKLVQIRIPVGQTSFQVEVVCDERI